MKITSVLINISIAFLVGFLTFNNFHWIQHKIHVAENKIALWYKNNNKAKTAKPTKQHNNINIWIGGCAHIGTEYSTGLSNFWNALLDSEKPKYNFNWDIMLFLGDIASHPEYPNKKLGKRFIECLESLKNHNREDIYCLLGNHDATTQTNTVPTNNWFQTYVDPIGENKAISFVDSTKRKYKPKGEYDHYKIDLGNTIILMLGDRNDLPYPIGRNSDGRGFPTGAVTKEAFEWWKNEVESNQNKIIITAHHHMLKETTAATGEYEGHNNHLHGTYSPIDEKASSYLAFIGKNESNAFNEYLRKHPSCIDLWLGAHTHLSPFDTINYRSLTEQKYGVTFVNCGAFIGDQKNNISSSRLLCLDTRNNTATIKTFIHNNNCITDKGWLPKTTKINLN